MRILVVGAAGYLGSMLTKRLLEKGHNVIAVDKLIFNQGFLVANILTHPNCEFHKIDVQEISDNILKKCEIIFPLAALVGMPLCNQDIKECYRVNTESIKWLVSKLSKQQRIIFPNSNSGYGEAGDNICDENTPLASLSDYGRSKELSEQIVMEMPYGTSYRLATVYGPSQRLRLDLLVNYLVYQAAHYNKLEVFEGDFNRNFVHIDDVINIFYESILDPFTFGQIFNLGQDKDNMSKSQLITKIKSHFPTLKLSYIDKKDPDKRNYIVTSAKLYQHYKVTNDIVSTLPELIKYFRLISLNENILKFMRNF